MTDLDLIPFRTLLDHVVVPARRHFRQTLLAVALPLTFASVAAAIAQVRWSQMAINPDPENFGAFFAGMFVVMGVVMVVLVVYVMAYCALMVASMDAVSGRGVDMGRAWRFVFRLPVFLTIVLVSILNGMALMLCFLPALYVVPLLSFTLPAMVDEGLVGMDAIHRSAELFRFNPTGRLSHSPWLQTLLLLFVGMVLTYVISWSVQMPFVIAQQVLILRQTFASPETAAEQLGLVLWLQVPASILNALATAVTWLYTTFGLALLYRELRRRKEATDLAAAVGELTGEAAAAR